MSEPQQNTKSEQEADVLSQILTPGSSRRPLFILALDVAFAALLCVFLGLLWITKGNVHMFVLIGIEACLWASVKWFIYELEQTPLPAEPASDTTTVLETKKEQ